MHFLFSLKSPQSLLLISASSSVGCRGVAECWLRCRDAEGEMLCGRMQHFMNRCLNSVCRMEHDWSSKRDGGVGMVWSYAQNGICICISRKSTKLLFNFGNLATIYLSGIKNTQNFRSHNLICSLACLPTPTGPGMIWSARLTWWSDLVGCLASEDTRMRSRFSLLVLIFLIIIK